MTKLWKRGRGKLGFMQPLLGNWVAEAESPIGPVRCTRSFVKTLGDTFIRLDACWLFGEAAAKAAEPCETGSPGGNGYQELALIGAGDEGKVMFWSFTSDGKH